MKRTDERWCIITDIFIVPSWMQPFDLSYVYKMLHSCSLVENVNRSQKSIFVVVHLFCKCLLRIKLIIFLLCTMFSPFKIKFGREKCLPFYVLTQVLGYFLFATSEKTSWCAHRISDATLRLLYWHILMKSGKNPGVLLTNQ